MENNEQTALQFDDVNRYHLMQTAKWAKFLSIVGFITSGLLIVLGLFIGTILSSMSAAGSGYGTRPSIIGSGAISFIYMLIAILYFFPCLYLFRFSAKMIRALLTNEQEILNESFEQLKSCFRYVGILTIITFSIYAMFIVALMAVAMMRH